MCSGNEYFLPFHSVVVVVAINFVSCSMFQGEGTLIIVLLVPPEEFRNGSRHFMRQLSTVLETIVFIKKSGNHEMIYSKDLNTGAVTHYIVRRYIVRRYIVRRAAVGSGTG